jgi:HAD superfamily hydrolase (TIGR01662 family)
MPDEDKLKVDPLPHQENLAEKLRDTHGQIVYHGTGTGKTITAVNAAHTHKLPLIAVVPAALRNNFRKGISDAGFTGDHEVISYEEAKRKLTEDPDFASRASRSLVAFDEAARMGRVDSSRSELAHKLPAAKKLFMTGTPVRNGPQEIAPLVNALEPSALPADPQEFKAKFLETREVPVGFWGRLAGRTPTKIQVPKNLDEFEKAVKGKVDFYQAVDRTHFPSHSESIVEVPMANKQQAAYDFVMGDYPRIAYKIRHGLPPSKSDEASFRAFFSGPRQVSNHPAPFHAKATDKDAPKIQAVVNEVAKRHAADPNYRGVVYSAFLGTGIEPVTRELERRGIRYNTFTGSESDVDRKRAVDEYNGGHTPLLLVSGAGAEGLDLKGTKHIAIMEPHWHEEQLKQVKARGIRYKSHAHLPEHERHVEVQRFHTVPQAGWFDRLLGRERSSDSSIDEYLYNRAKEKEKVIEPFLRVMQGEPAAKVQADVENQLKQSEFEEPLFEAGNVLQILPDNTVHPGFIFDLDETLVSVKDWMNPDSQTLLPGRLSMLLALKAKGYRLIAITNRAMYEQPQTLQSVEAQMDRTLELCGHTIDEAYYIPVPGPFHKPAPDMLYYAMHRHGLTPDMAVFVGDSKDDENAAKAAGVPYMHPDEFFAVDQHLIPPAHELLKRTNFENATAESGRLTFEDAINV